MLDRHFQVVSVIDSELSAIHNRWPFPTALLVVLEVAYMPLVSAHAVVPKPVSRVCDTYMAFWDRL